MMLFEKRQQVHSAFTKRHEVAGMIRDSFREDADGHLLKMAIRGDGAGDAGRL